MRPLAERDILVVEDEVLIAMELQDVLTAAGCRHVHLANSIGAALQMLAATAVDAAVLDVSVGGASVFPVADALSAKSVPFVLVTGHSPRSVPERHRQRPVLLKPYAPEKLVDILAAMVSDGGDSG